MGQNKIIANSTDDGDIREYSFLGSPIAWRQKAAQLKHAAEIIWPHSEKHLNDLVQMVASNSEIDNTYFEKSTFGIFLSLIGFSTECLFKGAIIKANPALISGGKLSNSLSTHNLKKLARIGNIYLNSKERIFCEQAHRAMLVDGRYPISKEMIKSNESAIVGGHCKEVFTDLYNRIYPTLGHYILTDKEGKQILTN